MVSFVALYRGRTLSDAELVGVSVRRELVNKAADTMLAEINPAADPVSAAVSNGRREALRILREKPGPATA